MSGSDLKQRLAAILAADVAGYSRLMAADERATVAALDAARAVFRAQIEANRGRVIDMAGDSVLAVFETATGSMSAALAIQQQLTALLANVPEDRRMRFRIGLHMGDVMEKSDGTIYGDGVNIAARLEGLAEPGGIMVSDSIRNAVKGKVSAGFEDRGEQTVKNIAEPVRAYHVKIEGNTASKPRPAVGEIDFSLPDKPSIAVLPFVNMSGDPEQQFFTDGVTEDIITELSRFHSLFVIARNSTFTYKGKAVDVRTVANELGVRYVMEGSIRRAGTRVRVTAQLVDALTGNHLWAERYDRVLEDIFAVQEEVTQSIVTAIAPQIDSAEMQRARCKKPENLRAYEIAVRASAASIESFIKSDRFLRDQSIREAKQALEIDAESVLALTTLAWSQWQHVALRTASDAHLAWQEGMDAATRAIESDPSDSRGYHRKGLLLLHSSVWAHGMDALAQMRRAVALNPNDVRNLAGLGLAELSAGSAKEAIEQLRLALRVSPLDPIRHTFHNTLALAHFHLKEYTKAIEHGVIGLSDAPNYAFLNVGLAVSYVGLDDLKKAKTIFETFNQLAPELAASRLAGEGFTSRDPEYRKRFTTFLRVAAGLEDPSAADALR